ncbi:hypothetical protein FGO68_gene7348 [Halteria grandinella]|uniref:Uncharacterized protein n=1 Tax=Halteria grandinella TaxID=5974 RepID=A0A8J8NC22_HALGN|nr:hypothetical protein FGO68_gene7348 [Halteria grandinella]
MLLIALAALSLSAVTSSEYLPSRQFEFVNLTNTIKQCYLINSTTTFSIQFRCDYKNDTVNYLESTLQSSETALSLLAMSWKSSWPVQLNFKEWNWLIKASVQQQYPYTESFTVNDANRFVQIDIQINWKNSILNTNSTQLIMELL